jgi:hypothetical protein
LLTVLLASLRFTQELYKAYRIHKTYYRNLRWVLVIKACSIVLLFVAGVLAYLKVLPQLEVVIGILVVEVINRGFASLFILVGNDHVNRTYNPARPRLPDMQQARLLFEETRMVSHAAKLQRKQDRCIRSGAHCRVLRSTCPGTAGTFPRPGDQPAPAAPGAPKIRLAC